MMFGQGADRRKKVIKLGQIAKRSDDITDEMWEKVNKFNRDMVQEFLDYKIELSEQSKIQYRSSLRIFFWWVYENLNDKDCVEIKKKEFVRYLNWLTNRGLSDSAIKIKKSVISSFCNFIVEYYEDEYPTFRSFVTSSMKVVKTGYVHEKQPLTPEEYEKLCNDLKELGEWQKLCWVMFSYRTGCRRAESRQLLKEVVDYPVIEKEMKIIDEDGQEQNVISRYYLTHTIRCKGPSVLGKPRKLKFSEDVMDAIKKWLEVRGEDDCPYVFVIKEKDGTVRQVSDGTFNDWCSGLLTKLVGRRVHPHLFRESIATNLVLYDHKSSKVAQKLLGHESVETTEGHYIITNSEDDESDEAFI